MNNETLSIAQSIGFTGTTWEQFQKWAREEHGVTVCDINLNPELNVFSGKIRYGLHYSGYTPRFNSQEQAEERTASLLIEFIQSSLKDDLCKQCGVYAILQDGYCNDCSGNLIGSK